LSESSEEQVKKPKQSIHIPLKQVDRNIEKEEDDSIDADIVNLDITMRTSPDSRVRKIMLTSTDVVNHPNDETPSKSIKRYKIKNSMQPSKAPYSPRVETPATQTEQPKKDDKNS